MASLELKNVISPGCGLAETVLVSTPMNKYAVVLGYNIANVTEGIISVSSKIVDTNTTVSAWLFKNIEILPGCSLVVCGGEQKINMGYVQELVVISDVEDSADVLVSYSEVTP